MKYEFALDSIKGVQNGALLYENGGKIEKINIKESAYSWWDIHNKSSILDIILKKKSRNVYAGDKCFNFVQSYIRMYVGNDEILFKGSIPKELDSSDAYELKMWWEHMNSAINQSGYWLFDEG